MCVCFLEYDNIPFHSTLILILERLPSRKYTNPTFSFVKKSRERESEKKIKYRTEMSLVLTLYSRMHI